MDDEAWMREALGLAREAVGLASPNPTVGCVLVRDGVVIGRGAHRYETRDHAEIVALKDAQGDARGATAYVTLEPCSHYGRTGPCADALLAAGIARCVVATVDANPVVAGRGIARLRGAGVEVAVGVCEAEARRLNEAFAVSITRGRPFVHLKAGVSVDGMLAPAVRAGVGVHWLTGVDARAEVQGLRHGADAVLVGIGTVLADDPLLTDRSGLARRRKLQRVVLDSRLRLPLESALVKSCEGDLQVFCTSQAAVEKRVALEERGVSVTVMDETDLAGVLALLHGQRVISVLAEGGARMNAALLVAGFVDRVTLYYSEQELGPGAVPFAQGGPTSFELEQKFLSVTKRQVGADVCVSGLLHAAWPEGVS